MLGWEHWACEIKTHSGNSVTRLGSRDKALIYVSGANLIN